MMHLASHTYKKHCLNQLYCTIKMFESYVPTREHAHVQVVHIQASTIVANTQIVFNMVVLANVKLTILG